MAEGSQDHGWGYGGKVWNTISEQPQVSPRVMRWNENLLKTDEARNQWKQQWAPHGAHSQHLLTPPSHEYYHLYQLISSCGTNPGPESLRFVPLFAHESPRTTVRAGDFAEGCLRCRQMRPATAADGTTPSAKCRQRLETEMRRESDPIIKRAEDKHTELEAEQMCAQEAIDARRAAEATRRGGGNEADREDPRP